MSSLNPIKTRVPLDEVSGVIETFLQKQPLIHIAKNEINGFPSVDQLKFVYRNGKYIVLLLPTSLIGTTLVDQDIVSTMIYDKDAKSPKNAKKIYAKMRCNQLDNSSDILKEIAENDMMFKKMLQRGKFFELQQLEARVFFSGNEIYDIDEQGKVHFAKITLSGKERFENSRYIGMEYLEREVIFNAIIEEDTYYVLTKADSNKMKHIQEGGLCRIYDGRDCHFDTTMTILTGEDVQEIHEKLGHTNNQYFYTTDGLVGLTFTKSK